MKTLDTPLTRLQAKHNAAMALKDQEVADLKVKMAKVRGVNDLLQLELVALERRLLEMQNTFDEVFIHVRKLKESLPDLGSGAG